MTISSPAGIGSLRIRSVSAAVLLASIAGVRGQAISIPGVGTYTQDFNTLPTSAGVNWTDNGTLPGWYAQTDTLASPTLPLGIYDGGAAVVSGLLSIGNSASTERALGVRPTSTNYGTVILGALFQNTSGSPVSIGNVEYSGELWFTQATANNRDGFQFFYQVATNPITSLTPFTVNNTATYDANAAVSDAGWTRFTSLDYSDINGTAGGALVTPVSRNIKSFLGITLQPNEYLMLRWRNPNDTAGDAVMGIDDLSVSFTGTPKDYNLSHTVGGAPDGMLAVSANPYWLSGTTPVGLASGDSIAFSQDITAGSGLVTITAPAAITLGTLTLGNTIGTYTLKTDADVRVSGIIGTGIQALRKTGAAALILTGQSSGNAGLIFDEGSIKLDSANGGSLAGAISTEAGITSTGGITVIGTGVGTAAIGGGTSDVVDNTYVGTTTVASGNLVVNKAAGVIAIPGDLVVQAGATFRYAGNNVGNQIADTSIITIDGGTFGDVTASNTNPANPGAAEIVAELTLTPNGGNFSSGRATFMVTGVLRVLAGTALAHRAGTIIATEVEVGAGAIDLDGGSTTAGSPSRLTVGFGGLTLRSGTINLNSHASAVSATSVGSILTLDGDVTSTGTSNIFNLKTAVMTAAEATVNLGGIERAFNVTGSLTIGTDAAPIALTNGGLVKDGSGNLILTGSQTLTSLTINDGVVTLGATPAPGPAAGVEIGMNDPLLDNGFGDVTSAEAVPEPGLLSLLAVGVLGLFSRRRRT
jgi:hypothetical protein